MAKPPKHSPPPEIADLLDADLHRRGMSEAEIAGALRKRKRAKVMELAVRPSPWGGTSAKRKAPTYRPTTAPSEELYTVEFVAERLKLHAKTVLRSIREGRLKATRVGKAYRIRAADLEAFTGLPANAAAPVQAPSTTCIVDIPGVGPDAAQTWARMVPAALNTNSPDRPAMRADVIHDPERSHLKIILVGPPRETVYLMGLIQVWLEQLKT